MKCTVVAAAAAVVVGCKSASWTEAVLQTVLQVVPLLRLLLLRLLLLLPLHLRLVWSEPLQGILRAADT